MERKAEYCLTQIFHYLVNGLAAIVFFCCIAYSGYALWDNWSILKEPDQVREDLIRYKPANEEELSYSFQELKAMNPDVCGWLTLDHTKIDYPVVQGCVVLLGIIFSLCMLLVDIAYAFVDPRIKAQYEGESKKKKRKEAVA